MTMQYDFADFEVSESLIERLAEEVRLEIKRRNLSAANSPRSIEDGDLAMPIVLRGRYSQRNNQWAFRSTRTAH
jgi:hypothetical protein